MKSEISKKDLAKKLVLDYFEQLHQKTIQGNSLTEQETAEVSQYNNLVQAIYRHNKGKITEHNLASSTPKGCRKISPSTIYDAIKTLEKEEEIEWFNNQLRYKGTENDYYSRYPILRIASEIQITQLPHQDLAFYRVSERYSAWVTEYINSQFHKGDIVAINLGTIIMCIDMKIPKTSASVKKKGSLRKRVNAVLQAFSLSSNRDFDDANGYSPEEAEKLHIRKVEKEREKQHKEIVNQINPEYGGKIISPSNRKVATRQSAKKNKQ